MAKFWRNFGETLVVFDTHYQLLNTLFWRNFGEILAKVWGKFGESLGKIREEIKGGEEKNKKHFVKPKHFYTFVLNFKT